MINISWFHLVFRSWCRGPITSDGHRFDESLSQSLVTVEVDGRVVQLEGAAGGGVGGVLGDGGEGDGGEALVSVVLRTAVRGEGRGPASHLVNGFGPRHDEAGGPVGLQIVQSNIGLNSASSPSGTPLLSRRL